MCLVASFQLALLGKFAPLNKENLAGTGKGGCVVRSLSVPLYLTTRAHQVWIRPGSTMTQVEATQAKQQRILPFLAEQRHASTARRCYLVKSIQIKNVVRPEFHKKK